MHIWHKQKYQQYQHTENGKLTVKILKQNLRSIESCSINNTHDPPHTRSAHHIVHGAVKCQQPWSVKV